MSQFTKEKPCVCGAYGGPESHAAWCAFAVAPIDFAEWFRRQCPPGTVISNPDWWIPRILRAVGMRHAQPDDMRERAAGVGAPIHPGECSAPDCDCEPGYCIQRVPATFTPGVRATVEPSNEELENLWETTHYGHPADFAADVLERWGGWPSGLLGHGGALEEALKVLAARGVNTPDGGKQ